MAKEKTIFDSDLLKKLYLDDKLTAPVIAEQLGSSKSVVYRALKDLGISPKDFGRTGSRGAANKKYPSEVEKQVAEEYAEGKSILFLAEKYNICAPTVKRYLKKNDVLVRSRGGTPKQFSEEQTQRVVELYNSGLSQEQISKIVCIHQTKISKLLIRAGIESHLQENIRGANHPSWKGGISIRQGYRLVYVDQNDPMLVMANASNYVFEHRLVMARHLGRPLETHETVHHIDGNRLNNELSNLQLMFTQPKGASLCCRKCGSFDLEAKPLGTTVEEIL